MMTSRRLVAAGVPDIGVQLEGLLASRWPAAVRAAPVTTTADLPVRVERCIRALAGGTAWRAYTDSTQLFCAIARFSRLPGRNGAVGLEVYFLDRDARIQSAGLWDPDGDVGWQLVSMPARPETDTLPRGFTLVANLTMEHS